MSAVIVSAVIKGVVYPKDLLGFGGTDSVVGWGTAVATALTSPTIGFGAGLILVFVVGLLPGGKAAKAKKA